MTQTPKTLTTDIADELLQRLEEIQTALQELKDGQDEIVEKLANMDLPGFEQDQYLN